MKSRAGLAALFVLGFIFPSALGQRKDLKALLLDSTFKIKVARKPNLHEQIPPGKFPITEGTAFIVGYPKKTASGRLHPVLITAKHLLENMAGDFAQIALRVKTADGAFKTLLHNFKLRHKGKPLYQEHPSADVIAMPLALPKQARLTLIPTNFLAGDNQLEKFEIRTDDTFSTLGFPIGATESEPGLPRQQSGKMVTSPLTPAKAVKTFYLDCEVSSGSSGGPVYFMETNRMSDHTPQTGEAIQFIAGLVSQRTLSAPVTEEQKLALALVVPAQFIKDTIEMLLAQKK